MLEAVIFDLDGVILDSHSAHLSAWQELLRELGREFSDRELSFVFDGYSREQILRHYLGNLPPDRLHEYGARKDQLFRKRAREITTVAGLTSFLEQLDAALIPFAVATSAKRARTVDMLDDLGLTRRFQVIITAEEAKYPKPDPEVFELAAQRLQVAADSVLVCEDSLAGVTAAKAAGMKCLAIAANGRGPLLKSAGADAVATDFTATSLESLYSLFTKSGYRQVPASVKMKRIRR